MRNPLSPSASQGHEASVRHHRLRPLLAILAALSCPPLLAGEIDDNAKFNATSAPQAAIPWMSGGVGDEARDEMRKAATTYNVLIVFSNLQGSYLASVPFAVAGRDGREILSGVSEGPLLYIKLPPASYRISAKIDGIWQNKQVQTATTGRPVRAMFVGRGE
jgi:hypothetical protein